MNNWQARAIIFLIVGIGGILSVHYTASHFKADRQLILLNTTRPDFHQFLDLEKQHASVLPKGRLKEYFDYFHLVNEAMPDDSEGALMLGYLYEIAGDKPQAQIFMNKAYRLNPSFFFTQFNLGLLSFEQGDYVQSADLLQKALAIPPKNTLEQMMNSVIYRQIFSSLDDNRDIIVGLRQAYQDADVLLMESLAKQKGLQGENVVAPEIHAQIM